MKDRLRRLVRAIEHWLPVRIRRPGAVDLDRYRLRRGGVDLTDGRRRNPLFKRGREGGATRWVRRLP